MATHRVGFPSVNAKRCGGLIFGPSSFKYGSQGDRREMEGRSQGDHREIAGRSQGDHREITDSFGDGQRGANVLRRRIK